MEGNALAMVTMHQKLTALISEVITLRSSNILALKGLGLSDNQTSVLINYYRAMRNRF